MFSSYTCPRCSGPSPLKTSTQPRDTSSWHSLWFSLIMVNVASEKWAVRNGRIQWTICVLYRCCLQDPRATQSLRITSNTLCSFDNYVLSEFNKGYDMYTAQACDPSIFWSEKMKAVWPKSKPIHHLSGPRNSMSDANLIIFASHAYGTAERLTGHHVTYHRCDVSRWIVEHIQSNLYSYEYSFSYSYSYHYNHRSQCICLRACVPATYSCWTCLILG